MIEYGGYSFAVPTLSDMGVGLDPVKTAYFDFGSEITEDFHSKWDYQKLSAERRPLYLQCAGTEYRPTFSRNNNLRVLDLPIKFPNSGYRLPLELIQFSSLIQKIINYELSTNKNVDEYYAYLTIDQSPVKKGDTQRKGGLHVDGFQGSRIEEKLPIDHSYIMMDCLPTRFCPYKYNLKGLDPAVDNFFTAFDREKREGTEAEFGIEAYSLYLMDAYCVHKSATAIQDTNRTFFRLSYSVRQYDRLGNTHNPMFTYDWNMVPRDTQSKLK